MGVCVCEEMLRWWGGFSDTICGQHLVKHADSGWGMAAMVTVRSRSCVGVGGHSDGRSSSSAL